MAQDSAKKTIKVGIDTSEAVAALKALQRAARATAKELREVESQSSPFGDAKFPIDALRTYSTSELIEELARRTGVFAYEPHDILPRNLLEAKRILVVTD